MHMLFTDFVSWWYGTGWRMRFSSWRERLIYWVNYFSLGLLLKTLFSPWRQIITQKPNESSMDQMIQAAIDNVISRFVGFWVRSFVFFTGLVMIIFMAVFAILALLIWPLIPIIPIAIIALGAST